jgi:hypothetical protein
MESEWVCLYREISQPMRRDFRAREGTEPADVVSRTESERENGEIYRAVLGRLFGGFGSGRGNRADPSLTILYTEADAANLADSRPSLNRGIRRFISRASADIPLRIFWRKDRTATGEDPCGGIGMDMGAVIRFTGIRRVKADRMVVEGYVHQRSLSPCTFECHVEKRGGSWSVKSSYRHWLRRLTAAEAEKP